MCDKDYSDREETAAQAALLNAGEVLCDCGRRAHADAMTPCEVCQRDICPDCARHTLSGQTVCGNDCELESLERYLSSGAIEADWKLSNRPGWRTSAQAEADVVAGRIDQIREAMLPEDAARVLIQLKVLRSQMPDVPVVGEIATDAIAVIRRLAARERQARTVELAGRGE